MNFVHLRRNNEYEILQYMNNSKPNESVEQVRSRAMDYIGKLFHEDIQENFFQANPDNNQAIHKIALVSTPRVGSTLLSDKLSFIAGKSIFREWLHNKYCIAYQKITGENFEPFAYLDQVYNLFNPETGTFILNVHIHQYEFWKTNYNINIFEYFEFDKIYYIKRNVFFDQVFSFATAMKSGLWGSDIEKALKLHTNFKVLITEKEIEAAILFLKKQQHNYQRSLEKHTDHTFIAESIMGNQGKKEVSYLIKDVGIEVPVDIIHDTKRHQPQKQNGIICLQNKDTMAKYFHKYMQQHFT